MMALKGAEYALMQIDVYSPSYSDTDVLMLQVINALNNIKAKRLAAVNLFLIPTQNSTAKP